MFVKKSGWDFFGDLFAYIVGLFLKPLVTQWVYYYWIQELFNGPSVNYWHWFWILFFINMIFTVTHEYKSYKIKE